MGSNKLNSTEWVIDLALFFYRAGSGTGLRALVLKQNIWVRSLVVVLDGHGFVCHLIS